MDSSAPTNEMLKDRQCAGYAQVRITGVACWKYQVFPFAFMYLEERIQIVKESKDFKLLPETKGSVQVHKHLKCSRLKRERLMKP